MSENALELHDVAVGYDGRTVLEVPHLTVRRGEILTLLGENGSGKTTLLRQLGLLVRPLRGRVVFDGEDVDFRNTRRLLEQRRRLAAVMQEPLLCRMSVGRNVALGLRFRGVPRHEADRRVGVWLEKLSISHLAARGATKLSGGEAQRTSLARALVLNPEVLFLDEPFAALDAPTRHSMLQEFKAVLGENALTAVFATHDRGEALALGDRVAVLMRGRMAQVGSPDAVFSRPKSAEVARFVGVETLVRGRVTGTSNGFLQVACGGFRIEAEGESEAGEEVCVAVRPDEIDLRVEAAAEGPGINVMAGRVTKTLPAETHYRVEIDCGVPVVSVVSRAKYRELGLHVGRSINAVFSARAAHIMRSGAE